MKVIDAKYNDLKFQLDIQGMTGNDMTAADFNVFDVTIYTVDSSIEPQYHKDDIPEDGILTVSSQLLENLSDGQISILIHYNFEDSEYPDNTVDKTINRHTKYYLDNSNYVSPDKKYPTEWGMIEGIIEKQTDLTDYIDLKITDGTEDYYTKSEIENKHYLTAHQSLTDYAKKTDLNNYSLTTHKHNDYSLTNHVHNDYTTKQYVDNAIKDVSVDLTGYATEEYVINKVNDVSITLITPDGNIDLSSFATKLYVDKKIADVSINLTTPDGNIDLSGFATKDYVDNAIKDVSINIVTPDGNIDLSGFATKLYVDNAIKDVSVDLTGYATEQYVDAAIDEVTQTTINNNYFETNFIVMTQAEYDSLEEIDNTKVYIITDLL